MKKKVTNKRLISFFSAMFITVISCMEANKLSNINEASITMNKKAFEEYAKNTKWWYGCASELAAYYTEGPNAAKVLCVANTYFNAKNSKHFEEALNKFGTKEDVASINKVLSVNINNKDELAKISYEQHINALEQQSIITKEESTVLLDKPKAYAYQIENSLRNNEQININKLIREYFRQMTIGLYIRFLLEKEGKI